MSIRRNISPALSQHVFPAFLLRHPQLIRFVHAWNRLTLQRNWLIFSFLSKTLSILSPGALVHDAGCGDGLYTFHFAKKFSRLRFRGIDKNEGNIRFCQTYARQLGAANLDLRERLGAPVLRPLGRSGATSDLKVGVPESQALSERVQFFQQNLEDFPKASEVDLLLCVGTLQYVGDDRLVLKNFFNTLKINGLLVLYVPVNGRTLLPLYRHYSTKTTHYENAQQRRRIYSLPEILEKTTAAGLTIVGKKFTYGAPGILAHEVYSLLLMGIGNAGRLAWFFVLLLLPALPFILIFNGLDYFFLPKKDGNGVLILAKKLPGSVAAAG